MDYNLRWPGLDDLKVYIIDMDTKKIYDEEKTLPARLVSICDLEHKYVRLIDVVSLFPSSMKVRVLNLIETLSSISSLKPLHKDKTSELRYLHVSSLLAFILVYPFCKPFQKTRDAILKFLMGFSETVCMDCGFIQRECQCSNLDEFSNGKAEETERSQTASPAKNSDPSAASFHAGFQPGLKLKTPSGQIVVQSSSQAFPLASPPVLTPAFVGGPLPPPGFIESTQAPGLAIQSYGSLSTDSFNKMSVSPQVENYWNTTGRTGNAKNPVVTNLFKMDPKSGVFVNDDFYLDPATGKVAERKAAGQRGEADISNYLEEGAGKRRARKRKPKFAASVEHGEDEEKMPKKRRIKSKVESLTNGTSPKDSASKRKKGERKEVEGDGDVDGDKANDPGKKGVETVPKKKGSRKGASTEPGDNGADTEGASDGDTSDPSTGDEEQDTLNGEAHKGNAPQQSAAKPTKALVKPPLLKVKMPFGHRSPQTTVVKPHNPGSILSRCNFGYTSSPITGAPIPVPNPPPQKPKQAAAEKTATSNKSNTDKKSTKNTAAKTPEDDGKGYAKFEFAQTGEKMLRCVVYTCGQVFDTERFAEIHHTLHQKGSPKELSCKLCGFKGHILRWYDMLRHLKQTHGSVICPKILPPKKAKKSENEAKEKVDDVKVEESDGGKEKDADDAKGKADTDVVEKSDGREENERTEDGSQITEDHKLPSDDEVKLENTARSEQSVDKSFEEGKTSQPELVKPDDGLSALANVCDKLQPIDTSSGESPEDKGDSSVAVSIAASVGSSPTKQSVLDAENKEILEEKVKKDDVEKERDAVMSTAVQHDKVEKTFTDENEKLEKTPGQEKTGEDEKATPEMPEEERNMCSLCGIKFDDQKELDGHYRYHYYNKYKCIHCGGIMYTWEHMKRHLKDCPDIEKGRVYFNCQFCHLAFRDRKSHYIHSISHGDPGLVCSYCDDDKSWDSWTALKKHYKVFHMAMRLLSAFKCDECNREFNTAKQYNNHLQDHKRRKERAAKMNKVDQKEVDDLKDLEIEVTADGLVKCPDCERTFQNNHHMEMHHKIKHGEEITCPKCTFVAKSKLMLKIHMGKAHIDKSHKCGECGKSFTHYHQYKVHLSTHAKKTTFSCKLCQAGYPTNSELRQHMLKEHKLPAHRKLVPCEECDFKCFSRTTLRAHVRTHHPESSLAEDGEDHCYFNKKEPSPPPAAPPRPAKKSKGKAKNRESVEKMIETKSKYFIMRHNTCCRTRSKDQNMEIKNRKSAAEKRFLEGPRKRGRKPKSVSETPADSEDRETIEKLDPMWSPIKDRTDPVTSGDQSESDGKALDRRASYPAEAITQEDIHKIHENRAPNKRRSAPPKRYSPEREMVQVKKRPKSPPIRPPKERRSKSPVHKKRRSTTDGSPGEYRGYQRTAASTRESARAVKERRKSAKQYEKRLKHEKPTLYAELMHVKKLKSVPMVVDQTAPIPVALLDHCYFRESRAPPLTPPDQYEDISYIHPDLSIVTTPDVADFEECLTDDVQLTPPPRYSHSRHRHQPPPGHGRQRGRGGTRPWAERQRPRSLAVRGTPPDAPGSTSQMLNRPGQSSRLGSLLADERKRNINVRIGGAGGAGLPASPQKHTSLRTVMASPDDSVEFDGETFLPSGVEMQDDILKVAADMFINEGEMSEEHVESSGFEHGSPASVSLSPGSSAAQPTPVVLSRAGLNQTGSTDASPHRKRVITITQQGLVDRGTARVVTESVPQFHAERVLTRTVSYDHSLTDQSHSDTLETMAEPQEQSSADEEVEYHSVTLSQDTEVVESGAVYTQAEEPGVTNEMAQELVQAILNHSRSSNPELDDIQLNEMDYNMLLGSRGVASTSTAGTSNMPSVESSPETSAHQPSRSSDHKYF